MAIIVFLNHICYNLIGVSMRKRKEQTLTKKIIIAVIISIIVIILLGNSLSNNKKLNIFETVIKDTSVFIIDVVTAPIKYIKDINTNYKDYITNASTPAYKRLKAENSALHSELEAIQKESSSKFASNFNSKLASVVIRNSHTWYNQITINLGKKDGLKQGQAVINNDGLIGVINTVSNHYATVDLLFNNRSQMIIPATVIGENQDEWGYIRGYEPIKQMLIFNKINNDINVKVGSLVVTSSLGGKLPVGIPIGKVSTIVRDEYGIVDQLEISPTADFNHLRYVTVLVGSK